MFDREHNPFQGYTIGFSNGGDSYTYFIGIYETPEEAKQALEDLLEFHDANKYYDSFEFHNIVHVNINLTESE